MKKIKPLGSRILIQRTKAQASKGGILLPETAQEKPKEGVVVAIGPGKLDEHGVHETVNVQVGARVLFGSYSGTEVKSPEGEQESKEEYLIIDEKDVLGILS